MPTANGWELYTASDDRETRAAVKAAVPALNAALSEAKREVKARIRAAIKARELRGERYGRRFYLDPDAVVGERTGWNGEKYAVTSADKVRDIIDAVVSEIVSPVQCKHAGAGAADTEPNWVAFNEVRKAACQAVNVDPRDGSDYFPQW